MRSKASTGTFTTTTVDATEPKVVFELDFTSDMTTQDVTASTAWPSPTDHDIKQADGTTTKVIMSSSYTTGTLLMANIDAESSVGITVDVDENAAALENMQWAFPIPVTTGAGALADWDPDRDKWMVEILIEDVVFGNNSDMIMAVVSSGKSYEPSVGASYGWELIRTNATNSEIKTRRTNTSGSTARSTGKAISGISGNENYNVQLILSRDECLVYSDNTTAYATAHAPTGFTGACGTYQVAGSQPIVDRWGAVYVVFLCLKDGGNPTTFTIKKIRVSRWSPGV